MKLRKGLVLAVAVLTIVSLFGACGQQPATSPSQQAAGGEWKLTVVGADKAEFTSAEYAKLNTVTIDTVLKKKDGSETPQKWEGVLMKDVVAVLGVKDYTSITFEGSDGYAKDYTPDVVGDAKTLLGTKVDGKALGADGGYVEAVAGSQTGNMWVRDLVKITVNK
jgi:DMSO/TMAO reductase YedYZ molybdopterin-dependent catalytic subunit